MEPVLHVTGWAQRQMHGPPPGRLFTIMARPATYHQGVARVRVLAPMDHLERLMLDAVAARNIAKHATPLFPGVSAMGYVERGGRWRPGAPPDPEEAMRRYRAAYEQHLQARLSLGELAPGRLAAHDGCTAWEVLPGDTLLCACSVHDECHRRWAAAALARAGWTVKLDGRILNPSPGP